jgi:seryl-tRNA synthetase
MRTNVNRLQKDVIAPKKKAKEPCEEEVQQMKAMQEEIKVLQKELPEIASE